MPTITLSSKHQVTLPVDIVRSLGLKAGDKLVAELIDGRVVLLPQPESWTDYFVGSMKGVYGSTLEEIDRYIAGERSSCERDEWREQFYDITARDPEAKKIVDWLRRCPNRISLEQKLGRSEGITAKKVEEALSQLVEHEGVRKIPAQPGVGAY